MKFLRKRNRPDFTLKGCSLLLLGIGEPMLFDASDTELYITDQRVIDIPPTPAPLPLLIHSN